MYIPRSGSEVTNGGVTGVMWSNLKKVIEGNGRSESLEDAQRTLEDAQRTLEDAQRTLENVEWVLFGLSRNSIFPLGPNPEVHVQDGHE